MTPKFRAWDKELKAMFEVKSLVFTLNLATIASKNDLFPSRTCSFDDIFLMQSTGLFDENGQEIWEGDVVEFEDADDIENVYINQGVIEWCQGGLVVTNRTSVTMEDLLDGNNLEVTVIGNIYENPELLFKDLPEDDRQLTDFPTCPVCDERTYSEDTCPFWSSEWSVDRARIRWR